MCEHCTTVVYFLIGRFDDKALAMLVLVDKVPTLLREEMVISSDRDIIYVDYHSIKIIYAMV